MASMFQNCKKIKSLDLSKFDVGVWDCLFIEENYNDKKLTFNILLKLKFNFVIILY